MSSLQTAVARHGGDDTAGASATILDISLDGIRFEVAQADAGMLGARVRLQVPLVALDVELERTWVRRGAGETVECGARLVDPDPSHEMAWQRVLDMATVTMTASGVVDEAPRPVPADLHLPARVVALAATASLGGWAHHLAHAR